jgi:hypothetical protein
MFKWVMLVVMAAGGGWYWGIDGSKLDDALVREFYEQQAHHTYSRDPDALCAQYAGKARVTQETRISGRTTQETLDASQACDKLREMFKFFEQAGEKAGGILTIEYDYALQQVEIAPNHKSASVAFTSTLKMGETFMQISTTATERLERSMRQVRLAGADAKVRVEWKPGALVNPELYFRSQ